MSVLRQLAKSVLTACLPRNRLLVSGPLSSNGRPRIALTFDDGPHPEYTPVLLDILNRSNLKATFFVVGQNATRFPDLIREMVRTGHEVANHTYTHSEPSQTSATRFLEEIRQTDELLRELTGQEATTVRPPKGELSLPKLRGLWRSRKTVALWNVDPKDYRMRTGAEMDQWSEDYSPSDGDIVLMHDIHPYASQAIEMMVSRGLFQQFETTTIGNWIKQTAS